MTKIAIIGSSISGHTLALALREKDKSSSISLLTDEPYGFYDRRRLASFISGEIPEKELLQCEDSFYQNHNISFSKNRKVSGINPKRKLIYSKDNEALEYDLLILASGCSVELPEITGSRKEGVFTLNSLDDFKNLAAYYIVDQVCIVGSDKSVLDLAQALIKKYKVEVKLFSKTNFEGIVLPAGVELMDNSIEEIIGDGGVQAVKLNTGKVIATSTVLYTDRGEPNVSFLKENGLEVSDKAVAVDSQMRTNIEGILACGSVCAVKGEAVKIKNWDDCLNEAKVLADILGREQCPTC